MRFRKQRSSTKRPHRAHNSLTIQRLGILTLFASISMSASGPDNDDLRWQQEQDAAFERKKRKEKADRRLWIGIILGSFAVAAIYPALIGIGPFGIQSVRADTVSVWVYNTTEHTADVDIAYNAPLAFHHQETLPPYGIERLLMKAGKRTLKITQNDQTQSASIDVQHPTLFTLGQKTCYAVFDVSEFYHGNPKGQEPDLRLVETLPAGTFMYQSSANVMVVPRQALPSQVNGSIHWVEDFGCDLLRDDQRDTLLLRARMKLEERQAALEAAQQR